MRTPQCCSGRARREATINHPIDKTLTSAWRDTEGIVRLVQKLRRNSPLRLTVEEFLHSGRQNLNDFGVVLEALQKPAGWLGWKEPFVATWVVGQAPLNEVQRSLAIKALVSILRRGAPLRKHSWWGLALWRTFLLMVSGVLSLLSLVLGVGSTVMLPDRIGPGRIRALAAASLGQLKAAKATPTLIDVLSDNPVDKALDEGKVSAAAVTALLHILPTLDEYNCAEMNTGLTIRLCRLLRHRDAGLVIEAVEALGRVGNGTAMAPVEQLAEKSKNEVVREKALLILPILKERRRLEELHGTLLRASGLPTADHALLRPAAHAGNDNAKELLRSVGED